MTSYTAATVGTSIACGQKYTAGKLGFNTYETTRAFLKFDLTGSGYTAGDFVSCELRIHVLSNVGSPNVRVRHSLTGWGTTLDSTEADFNSTTTNLEVSSVAVVASGAQAFSIDLSHIDFNAMNYFRFVSTGIEDLAVTKNFTFASNTNATTAYRPVLRFTTASGAYYHSYVVSA